MFRRPAYYFIVLGMAALVDGSGVGKTMGVEQFRTRSWTTQQGLPQNHITCLKQTRDGFLWVGTWFGLARFDGVGFTIYNHSNTTQLTADTINSLAEDVDGSLWIATSDGLTCYRDHQFQAFAIPEGFPQHRLWRLKAASGGGVWVQGHRSIGLLRNGKFSPLCDPRWQEGDEISGITEFGGKLNVFTHDWWITVPQTLNDMQVVAKRSRTSRLWLTVSSFPTAVGLWLGCEDGLFFASRDGTGVTNCPEVGNVRVDWVHNDRQGRVWINVGQQGVYRKSEGRWEEVDLGEGFEGGCVTCLEEDQEDNIWLGTANGLVQLHPQPIHTFGKRDGLLDENVWSVCEGRDHTVWVGTSSGIFSISANKKVVDWRPFDPQQGGTTSCVWPSPDGGVFASGRDLREVINGKIIKRSSWESLGGFTVALSSNRMGRLMVGTIPEVQLYDPQLPYFSQNNAVRIPVAEAHAILEDSRGKLWFGTKGRGLGWLENGTPRYLGQKNGLSSNNIWCIHEDSEHDLWLGTERGLTRYHKGKLFAFTTENGLVEDTVNWVLEDDAGCLWISGLRGIFRLKKAELNAVADGRQKSFECFAVGVADGMESEETNGETQPAGWKSRDGRLWFPTVRGLVVIEPGQFTGFSAAPVVIDQVLANNDRLDISDRGPGTRTSRGAKKSGEEDTRIPAGHARVVEFSFVANTFVAPERTRFRYRLLGADSQWSEETRERKVRYFNLRPGNYRFEVMAGNHHNLWNPLPASFAFSIAPLFSQTRAFYALVLLIAFALIGLLQAYRLRWQKRFLKLEEQRNIAAERGRIARDLHDELGTALTGLALELEVVSRDARKLPSVSEHLSATVKRTRSLAERMREVVWSVNPRCDTVSSLADFLELQVSQFLRSEQIQVHLEFPEDIPLIPLGADARHQLALCVREALTNVVRHSRATRVIVTLELSESELVVWIKDNGCGIAEGAEKNGDGLMNMRTRLKQVGGAFHYVSNGKAGTEIRFCLPIQKL